MSSFNTAAIVSVFLSAIYVVHKVLEFRKQIKCIDNHPGSRTVFGGGTLINNILPRIPYISLGSHSIFQSKYKSFEEAGWDITTAISFYPNKISVSLADPAAIKEITLSRARFPKPTEQYKVLSFFGSNIIIVKGDEWKRYRKISAPAFSDRNNKLVWDESIRIVSDTFSTVWADKDEIFVDNVVDITKPIALFVISIAGFGQRISWKDDSVIPPGHKMTFKESLHIVSTDIFLKLIFPSWAMGMTKRLRMLQQAFIDLDEYILEMIQSRRSSESKGERDDLFSALLEASDHAEVGQIPLTDRELIGNIFIFLVAGHETTAHTLAYAFALLALYPDQQEILYQHIKTIIPISGEFPTYEQMPLLEYSNAVLYETLRMFPPVTGIPKMSAEDTVITASNANGEKKTIPLPQGSDITVNTAALHYNRMARYWKDPNTFNPARFLEEWPKEAFLPFSGGPRACIGRKFGETEGIAILTLIIARYKVEVKDEPRFSGETFEERKARVLQTRPGLTITPVRVPLVFKRR